MFSKGTFFLVGYHIISLLYKLKFYFIKVTEFLEIK